MARRVVWIVDDSPLDAERAARTLSPPFETRVFLDGAQAIERLHQEQPPDVLVLDSVMPGVSGVELCRHVRQTPNLSGLGVLMLTARRESLVEGLEAGANDHVTKPFDPVELRARVTALVRSRELLERAERAELQVRRLLEQAPDGLLSVRRDGVITFATEEGARIFGRTAEEMVGATLGALLPELSLRRVWAAPSDRFLTLPDLVIGEGVYSPRVRTVIQEDTLSLALRDVSDRREAEARRLDLYALIAHELRTPLSAMLLRTHGILSGRHGVLRPELIADVRKVESNIRSLVTLINDFLDLARLEGIQYRIKRVPVDLDELVRSVLEDFRPLLEAGGLEARSEGGQVTVLGERARIAQVLTNLVGNAIKFTPPGGLISVSTRLLDDEAEVRISDDGPGIPEELRPLLFRRFIRGREAQKIAGTGLGLMIVREIVEAHGGQVGVESTVGEGSTFWFRVPMAR